MVGRHITLTTYNLFYTLQPTLDNSGIAAPEAKKKVFLNNFKEGYYIVDADEAITQFDDKDVEALALALKNKNINTCKIEKM